MSITDMKEATEGAIGVPMLGAAGVLRLWDYQLKSVINPISSHLRACTQDRRYLSTASDSEGSIPIYW